MRILVDREYLLTLPPYDRMKFLEDENGAKPSIPPLPDDPEDPCYGCGNWYGPCIWPCFRQMGYDKFPKRA